MPECEGCSRRGWPPRAAAATGLLVANGVIAWLGRDPDAVVGHADAMVELDGALVTPAFVDAHVHATDTGLALSGLDLSGAASLAEALDAVERHARRAAGRPVLGTGWDETRGPDRRAPTRHELDRAGYGGLVYLSRVDGHSAVVSSGLLAAAPELAGLAGFSDSGQLRTDAHHAARRIALDAVTPGQRRDAQRATLRHAAGLGIGCLHEMAGPRVSSTGDLEDLLRLAADQPAPEVVGYWGELDGVDTARALGAEGAAGDLFADGALGSHTAWLSAPYADAPGSTGHRYLDSDAVARHAVACSRAGLQAGFHAIGDAAVEAVVRGYAAAAAEVGLPAFAAGRHRVEHLEMVDPALMPELARLGVLASVRLAFGSDAPVTPLAPWEGVRAAARHRTPGHRLPVAAAFAAHTRGGALAGRRDGGALEPGAPATFAVWAAGELGPDGLPDLAGGAPAPACLRTVVRGATVYEVEG